MVENNFGMDPEFRCPFTLRADHILRWNCKRIDFFTSVTSVPQSLTFQIMQSNLEAICEEIKLGSVRLNGNPKAIRPFLSVTKYHECFITSAHCQQMVWVQKIH